MCRLLIFGGTTEGRQLAEFCSANGISADVSVATDYGASLLSDDINVLCGRLDSEQMTELIMKGYEIVVDATHPYAVEATENIRRACSAAGTRYLRFLRRSTGSCGRNVRDMSELIDMLNDTDSIILSTLGSKSLSALTAVRDFSERIWVRILPGEEALAHCLGLGYDTTKIIQEKGPFSVSQNIEHLRKSNAGILLTKESGTTGGYPEKTEAARICGAELITLERPIESGFGFDEIIDIIEKEIKK